MADDTTYNGWRNYETWNVALWIQNDEGLYGMARAVASAGGGYGALALHLREMSTETPDGVAWNDSGLDVEELDEMLSEMAV